MPIFENREYLTYDDVLLLPGYTDFERQDITLKTRLTRTISLEIPFVSAPMDTVTEAELALVLAKRGGIGIIHRNLTVASQAQQVKLVKKDKLLVGAAVGVSAGYKERVAALVSAGVDVIVLDSAHGYAKGIVAALQFLKKTYSRLSVIAGNIATGEGAEMLIAAGADGLRVGMGPGAICTTRVISGMGVPQVSAILECNKVARHSKVPLIADGGIKYSGDMVKALAAGAASVMMGSFFASCKEAPGKTVLLKRDQVPRRFQSIFKSSQKKTFLFKQYRGMGSIGAMKHGAKIKSEDEYHGKNYQDRVLVAEGVEGLVPVKGSVENVLDQAIGGIKSGMYYVGSRSIKELQEKARFIKITQASLTESHPHDILVTNPGENY